MGMFAWVTSAVREAQVGQALVLAGSLRRARTAMKLVVIATPNISASSRGRLADWFDLVIVTPDDGQGPTEFCSVLISAFSLVVFEKCIYLTPTMLTLRNFDSVFDTCELGGAGAGGNVNAEASLDCFLYAPSNKLCKELRSKMIGLTTITTTEESFQVLEQVTAAHRKPIIGRLGKPCEVHLGQDGIPIRFPGTSTTSLANFVGLHPSELWNNRECQPVGKHWLSLGPLGNEAMDLAWRILREDVAGEKIAPTILHDALGSNEPVAIVGMSFRLPGGNTPHEFWNTLVEGKDAVRAVPSDRWRQEQVGEYWKEREVQAGFLGVPIDEFDAKFFGLSQKEAVLMDPQQRFLHEVSWEALEDAGIDPLSLHGSQTAVFTGSWIFHHQELVGHTPGVSFFRSYMGNSIATGAARLSHFYGCTGPSIATESGCSSAMVAVDLATKSLRHRECGMALVCGVNLIIKPFNCHFLEGVLAPDYRCKTFDARANGFARAEGVTALVMKRLSDALRDEDPIWGLVRGTGIAQEGVSKSLGTPTVQVESLAMRLALKDAGVQGADVSYIEMHGTGTPVGDPLEVAAVAEAYGVEGDRRKEPLLLGSVKTNIGHTESASGIVGIIKVLLSMKHEKIPPHLHLEHLNPEINLERIPAAIPKQVVEWRRGDSGKKRRIAGVSSFGISGTDGHVILEEPPSPQLPPLAPKTKPDRPVHVLKLSATCAESLERMAERYTELLSSVSSSSSSSGDDRDDVAFPDICYSANTGRSTFSHRAVILAGGASEAAQILRERSFKKDEVTGASSNNNALCFLFTGQGSQYHGMASTLYATSPTFQLHFDRAASILHNNYNIDIKEVLWAEGEEKRAAEDDLSRTLYSQTSIFVVEVCLLRLWESWGVKPDYVMGHSLGEFTAAVAADALTFEDALLLVAERSRLIDNLPRGKMLVVKACQKVVEGAISKYKHEVNAAFWADMAALNSKEQTVLAGDSEMLEAFASYCTEQAGLKNVILASTHAFHSRHMDPVLESYRRVASKIKGPSTSSPPAPPSGRRSHDVQYISGMEGRLLPIHEINADYWVRHTREPVSFMEATRAAAAEGCNLFLEVGPHPVLSALTAMNLEGYYPPTSSSSPPLITCLPSLRRGVNEWSVLLESLAKLYLSHWKGSIDWRGFDRDYPRRRVPLPFYPFNRKRIWLELRPVPGLLHPLLGRAIPSSSSSHSLYENELLLKEVGYVGDHMIGNRVIFPGAGFLEMCLAAGFASVQRLKNEWSLPRRALALSDLTISTPLAIHETRATLLQTAVMIEEEVADDGGLLQRYRVKVSRHNPEQSGEAEWASHATAKFHPTVDLTSLRASWPTAQVDVKRKMDSWANFSLSPFYSSLPDVGLRFGPHFQSLESGWKGEEGMLLRVKVPKDHHHNTYLIHPIVTDAMLQALMLWNMEQGSGRRARKKLEVPVLIRNFTWIQSSDHHQRFILCGTDPDDRRRAACSLVDGEGRPLATMSSVEFLETSVKLVEGMILQQSAPLPKMYEEIYKSFPGPRQNRLQLEQKLPFHSTLLNNNDDRVVLRSCSGVSEEERLFHRRLCDISRNMLLQGLYSCGWCPQQGVTFRVGDLLEQLGIGGEYHKYVRFFIRSFAEEGLLEEVVPKESFRFPDQPPAPQTIAQVFRLVTREEHLSRMEYKLIRHVGNNLRAILLGQVHPLQVLFPSDPSKPSVAQLYSQWLGLVGGAVRLANEELLSPVLHQAAASLAQSNGGSRGVVRILEVGAGTGAFSRLMLSFFQSTTLSIEYFYTDVSPSFFAASRAELEGKFGLNTTTTLVFKRFNMEEDPFEQGFCPGYFDLLLACEVLHVATDIKATLRRLRPLLKVGGMVQIIETITQDPRITFMFGPLPGYWQFQDLEFRQDHITLTPPMWAEALLSANFEKIVVIPTYQDVHGVVLGVAGGTATAGGSAMWQRPEPPKHAWLLFDEGTALTTTLAEKLRDLNRAVYLFPRGASSGGEQELKEALQAMITTATTNGVHLEGLLYLWALGGVSEQAQISLPLVSLCQVLGGLELSTKVAVVTQGVLPADGLPLGPPFAGSLGGLLRAIAAENLNLSLKHLDCCPVEGPDLQLEEIFANLWDDSRHHLEVAFRAGQRLQPKLAAVKQVGSNNDFASLPHGTNRFQLVLPPTRQFSDLEFAHLDQHELEDDQLEVELKAMALNFRDVFAVLKPSPEFDRINAVGLDAAGIVSRVGRGVSRFKVGDRVLGMQNDPNLALPSHVKLREGLAIPLPRHLTFVEGATLPAVLATAHHCLVTLAKMKGGERLLVHTASGGVGLAAIQLAARAGVEVIATAGSPRKRRFLRDLGIRHVFNSRATDFGANVMGVTGGAGVHIVLNSLTGPGFKEESLGVLAHGGRFVEMSKLNVWSGDEVALLRPDVLYSVADVSSLDEPTFDALTQSMEMYIQEKLVAPIPYERFDALNIRAALTHMQGAKHIGKIVCVMPELGPGGKNYHARTPMFNESSTYLVTGGLGGIGLEVVKWILRSGGKHVVIASRRSTPKPAVSAQLEQWNGTEGRKHVEAVAVDVGDYEQCEALFHKIREDPSFPPLRGVMHAAGVLADATLQNQSWDKFRLTFNPKIQGSWNLHELSKGLLLEHFVLFSSFTATFGSPGQANHCASNRFQDTLAHYRHSIGLPATSVNWGNWGEVGVATDVDLPGVTPLSTSQGILALETLLRSPTKTNVAVANIDSFSFLSKLYNQLGGFLEDRKLLGDSAAGLTTTVNAGEFWARVDSTADPLAKLEAFSEIVKSTVRGVSNCDSSEVIEDNADFTSLGIDSLMMLEMKNGLQNILGGRVSLSVSHLKDANTPATLAERLLSLAEGASDAADTMLTPSLEDLKLLVREDSVLPPSIRVDPATAAPGPECDEMRIGTVLLTGATGTLGPFLLHELLQRPSINAVYCLIRKAGKMSPTERLLNALERAGLSGMAGRLSKVICVQGEVSEPRLGLSPAEYDALASRVDAVVHSAAKVDYNGTYWRAPQSNKSAMRTTNVLGTLNVLDFCTSGRLKQLCYMSTLLLIAKLDANGCVSEGWQDLDAFDDSPINIGYAVSKHVAEQLIRQAVERGVPCKAIRLPLVGGHSHSGRCEPNHFLLRFLAEMKLGCMPESSFPLPCIPVDRCAQLALSIFFHRGAGSDVYNLIPKLVDLEQELVTIAREEFGLDIALVSYQEFIDKVLSEDDSSPLAPFKTLYTQDFATNPNSPYVKIMQSYAVNSQNFFCNGKTVEVLPDFEAMVEPSRVCFRRDLRYLKGTGLFQKFGIPCK